MYVYMYILNMITASDYETGNKDTPKRAMEEKEAGAMMEAALKVSAFAMASQTAVPTNVYIHV